MNFKILVMAWLLLLLSLISGATAATLEWSKETVDSDGNTRFYTSIALDSSENFEKPFYLGDTKIITKQLKTF